LPRPCISHILVKTIVQTLPKAEKIPRCFFFGANYNMIASASNFQAPAPVPRVLLLAKIVGQRRAVAVLLCLLLPVVAAAAAAKDPASTCGMAKNILVTGGNAGIGLALCKILATGAPTGSEYPAPAVPNCKVFLGSRSAEKGAAAVKSITDAFPDAAGKIEMVQIDVTDDASCAAAAESLKAKGVTLYALVNNAGMGLAQPGAGGGPDAILNTNFYGPKRVTEAMLPLIDTKEGRIVHTSSGAASMYLKKQSAELKALFSNPNLTFEALETCVKEQVAAGNVGFGDGYGSLCRGQGAGGRGQGAGGRGPGAGGRTVVRACVHAIPQQPRARACALTNPHLTRKHTQRCRNVRCRP